MNQESRVCQNCKSEFVIEPEDFEFYAKIKVPAPTWCPECRNNRRMAWREERTLYHDTCQLCKKPTISIHAPNGPFTIFCRDCWKSDKWDPMDYGQDYDFSQPFFPQYRQLMEKVPRPALTGSNLVDSEFTHISSNCKKCYFVFCSYFTENSQNCYALLFSKDCFDCYITDNSDHAYESLHSNRLYKTRFAYFSDDCFDSSFLYDCVGCSDCFGCVNLRKQKYCLFNQQLSKEEYHHQMEYWDLGNYKRLQEAKEKFRALYLSLPHRFAHIRNSQNVTGDIIRDANNCQTCFSTLDEVENCKFLYFGGLNLKDSYDVSAGGDTSSLFYEIMGITQGYNCIFSGGGGGSQNVCYSDWTYHSSNIFGCISLKHKKYCILNKQYTEEEYEKLVPQIIEQMNNVPYIDKLGRVYKFGEFFPPEFSAWAYNESFMFSLRPKTKEEVLKEGWQWRDPTEKSPVISLRPENLPNHIKDVSDSILQETIGCQHAGQCNEQCSIAFRITPDELKFYRQMNIALP
ncbi:MAG: zinc-ribbon domain containing protein, partial [Candidatus Woesebacteria bacterium]|nr:zinc-ribbon domain containing protein [Candidatus Woesebacteria bacterium]